ncbi:hypothetical protein ACIBQX_11530 [Nonomuraea sp. NPDC049714]|uniref:hypothetical protein n=1 Tax=Nonomuraea sp. NPDC049714 TaxID=3364357 RepID=UPI00379458D9
MLEPIPEEAVLAAPAELIEAALRKDMRIRPQERATATLKAGEPIRPSGREAEDAARIAVEALAGAGLVAIPAELLQALTDPDECWFDHHGGCQAHGFLSLEPGERCPHAEAREILAALPERNDHADRE